MSIRKILESQKKLVQIDDSTKKYLESEAKKIVGALKAEIVKGGVKAEVFVGGSFAKGTLAKNKEHDIDIFVRFDLGLSDLSPILEKIVEKVSKEFGLSLKKIHGSRDYFRLENGRAFFEIIPVCKIKKPKEARNVTDLSYFHVNYVRKKILMSDLAQEIMLAKQFFRAQGIYGAESYIKGFSGYGIECLIIHYGSFQKMLIELLKVKIGERLILDPEKFYKRKGDVLFELNESKLHSPVILVDPTWKERNVLAALNNESFLKFQTISRKFLKNPQKGFFEIKVFDSLSLKKLKGEFLHLKLNTQRQAGDIAGTKMKKFSRFLEGEFRRYFSVSKSEFVYIEGGDADFYLVVNPKKEVVRSGPPISMKKRVSEFKKRNNGFFEVKGKLYSKEEVNFNGKAFLTKWKRKYRYKIDEMGISGLKVA